jgi:hypothetical protein
VLPLPLVVSVRLEQSFLEFLCSVVHVNIKVCQKFPRKLLISFLSAPKITLPTEKYYYHQSTTVFYTRKLKNSGYFNIQYILLQGLVFTGFLT